MEEKMTQVQRVVWLIVTMIGFLLASQRVVLVEEFSASN